MKTYQYHYQNLETFTKEIDALQAALQTYTHSAVIFHAFAECWCQDEMKKIRQVIRVRIPEASLVGTASFGNICEGGYTRDDIVLTAMVFEKPDTRAEVICCPIEEDSVESSLASFLAEVAQRPAAKAVEAFIMGGVEMVTRCCEILNALPEEVSFFGGKSRFDHSPVAPKFVITDEGEIVSSVAAFVIYSGEELHIQTDMIVGWNPLGRPMQVTKHQGDILCELDGRPAHELYYKYLHIKNDENFFFNTLEFPFLFYRGDRAEIRISHACLPDGSMVLGASIPENDYVRIAFGDAAEIMRSVLAGGRKFESFRPDGIILYSCGCRRTYWGDENSNRETKPFEALAPTSGYYTAGELLRTDGLITEHNSTMVVAAFREGAVEDKPKVTFGMTETDIAEDSSLVNRLSTFISAAIEELEEANRRLEVLSITDGLTGVYNRRETERLIRAACEDPATADHALCLMMMDLDNFKQVNDTYGHHEGDLVLQSFADQVRKCVKQSGVDAKIGRWGGEEFIVLLPGADMAKATALAEQIRDTYAKLELPVSGRHTVSIGVTQKLPSGTTDTLITRVDAAMYEAKHQGKNRVVEM